MILLALAGGGFWAWNTGRLNAYLPDGFPRPPASAPADDTSDTVGMVDDLHPVSGEPTGGQLSKEELLLREHDAYVSSFAASVPELAAAMMWQESRGNPAAVSSAGALGLMQVMPATAKELHDDRGYTLVAPTTDNLLTAAGSIYFGTAYMEWLQSIRGDRSTEWLIRAYNGGPTGAQHYMDNHPDWQKGKPENDGYYTAVLKRWTFLKNSKSVAA